MDLPGDSHGDGRPVHEHRHRHRYSGGLQRRAIAGVADVTDTDPSNHFGATAGINVVKSTNGQDANTATGPLLAVGSTATFTYVVTNTGNVPLATVVVRDDNGTAGNTADDFDATFQSGDTNSNGRLDTTETWTYQATRTVTAGQYTNIGTATANPVDETGADITGHDRCLRHAIRAITSA